MESGMPRLTCHPAPVACAVACVLVGLASTAWGQATEGTEMLNLVSSPLLQEKLPTQVRGELPVFLFGHRLSGQTGGETLIEGDAELRRGETVIRADRLLYRTPDDLARASGHVHINRAGNVYEGPELELQVETFKGFFVQPTFDFLKSGGHGEARRLDFVDEKHAVVHDATYTTCRRSGGPEWLPDWVLRATQLTIDNDQEIGRAEGAVLRFKDVPILPVPAISFPLGDKRKTGLLAPSIGLDSVNGVEFSQPWYLNLAPNRDATLTPTLMSRRGVDLGGEYRYLASDHSGQVQAHVMPSDTLRSRVRWGISALHTGDLPGAVGLSVKLNRVSDDNYWRDFARVSPSLTGRLLPNDANLNWSAGDFTLHARTLKWQTLQDVSAPIIPPYDRMPQLAARYARSNLRGLDFSVDLDYTRFASSAALTSQPNAHRAFALAQLSRPWVRPGGFITPKLQVHATRYAFDSALSNGAFNASRVLPTFSVDSGLVFERDAGYFGRAFRQTLEPRAFYAYTPYRNQSALPNYDSGANDFNFATLYSENSFVGHDRIADNNLLTLGVTTRLLDPTTGGEAARFGIAQRLRFSDQNVTLPGVAPVSERLSDVLVGGSVNWNAHWSVDATVQFNPKTGRSVRTTMGGRYNPGSYRVVNAAYRLQRGLSEQIDLGWQWPLNDLWGDKGKDMGPGQGQGAGRWYSVGRMNYSMKERKLVDVIAGFEYDAGCWIGRIVLDRLQSSTTTSSKRVMLQLEFVGFSHLGSSPLKTLQENIPRYQYLREPTSSPSRFTNHD